MAKITQSRKTLRNESRAIRELMLNYSEAIDTIRDQLARVYEKYAERGRLTNAEMSKYNRLTALERQLTEDLRPVMLKNEALTDKLRRVQYDESFYRRAFGIDDVVGVQIRWGLLDTAAVRAALNAENYGRLYALAKDDLRRGTLVRARRAIAQGLIRGVTLREMMGGIRDAMGVTANDAMRIVRTEAHRARELGSLQATERAVDAGVDLVRVWDASLDSRTRTGHARLDGEAIEPDGKWCIGGVCTRYPGGFGVARLDINCRCTTVDEVRGFEPVRRRIEGRTQPYRTFRQWAQAKGIKSGRYGQEYDFVR